MYSDAFFKHRRQSNREREREPEGGIDKDRMKKRVSEIERD